MAISPQTEARERSAVRPVNCPSGVLAIDKPVGMTSHDVVDAIRKLYRTRRVGHTGTLDPAASGLLILVVEKATKLAQWISDQDKSYEATIRFGATSDTDDREGTIVDTGQPIPADSDAVKSLLPEFSGSIDQRIPDYSAARVDGRRRYELARQGRIVPAASRQVSIHDLRLTSYNDGQAGLSIRCSSGTYIRSLARDLGELAGCGAYLTDLRRTAIGHHAVESAHSLKELFDRRQKDQPLPDPDPVENYLTLTVIELRTESREHIVHGRPVACDDILTMNGDVRSGDTVLLRLHGDGLAAVATAQFDATDGSINNLTDNPFRYLRVLI